VVIENAGDDGLELLLTDGSRVQATRGECLEIEQNRSGRFVRVLRRGRRIGGRIRWNKLPWRVP